MVICHVPLGSSSTVDRYIGWRSLDYAPASSISRLQLLGALLSFHLEILVVTLVEASLAYGFIHSGSRGQWGPVSYRLSSR